MKVAVLATDGVEQVELDRPWQVLEEAGAEPELVSLEAGSITAFDHIDKGDTKKVDAVVSLADPDSYAALVLPGGVINGDFVRADADAVAFVKAFFDSGKPVAAICHAPWVLAEADVVRGRRMTSWPSLQTDLRNAGANWVDEEVVVDGNLITSRNPDDLDAFGAAIVEQFARSEEDEAEEDVTGPPPAVRTAGEQPGGGRDRQQGAGEHEDRQQPRAHGVPPLPLPPDADARDEGRHRQWREQDGDVRDVLPEQRRGEVDADAGGQGDDQFTGEPQPRERTLLRRGVQIVGVLELVGADDGDRAGRRVRIDRCRARCPAARSRRPLRRGLGRLPRRDGTRWHRAHERGHRASGRAAAPGSLRWSVRARRAACRAGRRPTVARRPPGARARRGVRVRQEASSRERSLLRRPSSGRPAAAASARR